MNNYLVFNTSTGIILASNMTLRQARSARTRNVNAGKWDTGAAVTTLEDYDANHRRTKKVKNLMTGVEIEIDVNTPRACDPSTELYWSM